MNAVLLVIVLLIAGFGFSVAARRVPVRPLVYVRILAGIGLILIAAGIEPANSRVYQYGLVLFGLGLIVWGILHWRSSAVKQ